MVKRKKHKIDIRKEAINQGYLKPKCKCRKACGHSKEKGRTKKGNFFI